MDRAHDQFGAPVSFPGELVDSPAVLRPQALRDHVLAQGGSSLFALLREFRKETFVLAIAHQPKTTRTRFGGE
jgi:hypothetical protein